MAIEVNHALVIVCTVFGMSVFLSSILGITRMQTSFSLALDFWTAAGLIRLSGVPSWHAIGTAAALIALRKITNFSMHHTLSAPK